jgi:glycosyltransferase involved in cell wall biosynthesis
MRILHTESSLAWGGQEIRILTEAKGFLSRGHHVVIAAQPESLLLDRARREGMPAESVSMKKTAYPSAVASLRRMIEKHEIDLVNTHSSRDSWLGLFASRLSKRRPPLIRTRHLSTPLGRGVLTKFLYARPDRIVTTGEAIRRRIIEELELSPNRIVSIPTGIDTNYFQPSQMEPEREGLSVGIVAFLRSWKGHDDFIEAAREVLRKIPSATFYIVGNGPAEPRLRAWLEQLQLGERIQMLGYQPDVRAILSKLDIVVLTSYANEGVPQSLLQAMAMGRPVIGTTVGGIPEVIHDGINGYLIPPKDASACAEKIIALLENRDRRLEMGKAGRAIVEKEFSFDRMLDEAEGIYRAALQGRGGE